MITKINPSNEKSSVNPYTTKKAHLGMFVLDMFLTDSIETTLSSIINYNYKI